jgi:hypothetical protein
MGMDLISTRARIKAIVPGERAQSQRADVSHRRAPAVSSLYFGRRPVQPVYPQ